MAALSQISDLDQFNRDKRAKDALAVEEAKAAEEARLVALHGEEGLKKLREEEAAEKARKQKEVDDLRKRTDNIATFASLIVTMRKNFGAGGIPTLDVTDDSILPKPQAKELCAVTDATLKGLNDHGPSGRAKSSYRLGEK